MNIIRGTFRLSILVGLASLGYFWWQAIQAAGDAAASRQELWSILRCGKSLLPDTSRYENQYGNIDLGKMGCASRQFWARKDEIEEALRQESPYQEVYAEELKWRRSQMWYAAAGMFVLTNLLGFAYLGLRAAYQWVFAGYKAG